MLVRLPGPAGGIPGLLGGPTGFIPVRLGGPTGATSVSDAGFSRLATGTSGRGIRPVRCPGPAVCCESWWSCHGPDGCCGSRAAGARPGARLPCGVGSWVIGGWLTGGCGCCLGGAGIRCEPVPWLPAIRRARPRAVGAGLGIRCERRGSA
jgi:hypothetical protein